MRGAVGLLASVLFVTGVPAQWSPQTQFRGQGRGETGGLGEIQGRVIPHGGDNKDLQVLLIDQSGNQTGVADVSLIGTFSFSGVQRGRYTLRLLDAGRPVSEGFVTVEDLVETVDLTRPRDRRENIGGGTLEHLVEGALIGHADGLLAASIFHFGRHTIAEAKEKLAARGVSVRPAGA